MASSVHTFTALTDGLLRTSRLQKQWNLDEDVGGLWNRQKYLYRHGPWYSSSGRDLNMLVDCRWNSSEVYLNKIAAIVHPTSWSRTVGVNQASVKMCAEQSLISCCWVSLSRPSSTLSSCDWTLARKRLGRGTALGPCQVSLAISTPPGSTAALSGMFCLPHLAVCLADAVLL